IHAPVLGRTCESVLFRLCCAFPPNAGGCSRVPAPTIWAGRSIGFRALFQNHRVTPDLRSLSLLKSIGSPESLHFSKTPPVTLPRINAPHAGNETPGTQVQNASRTGAIR